MPLTREDRIELLAKARDKKKQLAEERKQNKINETPIQVPKTKKLAKIKEPKRSLDISTIEDVKNVEESFEIKNEVIRIKAPKKKTIIKRVIEVEEPSSDEEIQEEIVNVPRAKKSVKTEPEMKIEPEPKSTSKSKAKETFKNSKLFYDIFPTH